jgi:hypothetical protein
MLNVVIRTLAACIRYEGYAGRIVAGVGGVGIATGDHP